jgi:hypothetical protein
MLPHKAVAQSLRRSFRVTAAAAIELPQHTPHHAGLGSADHAREPSHATGYG